EKEFYEKHGVAADWVGHPIFDEMPEELPQEQMKTNLGFNPEKKLLALMPGSRSKVFSRLAPIILKAAELVAQKTENLELAIPLADSISPELMASFIAQAPLSLKNKLKVIPNLSREILKAADVAIVASGTSSVEAAIIGTPTVVTYKVSPLSWAVGRKLVSVPYASIANLVAGREIIPEFLQEKATPENIALAASTLLSNPAAHTAMKNDLAMVRTKLGPLGASARVVEIISQELNAVREKTDVAPLSLLVPEGVAP
ncbi:MAG: lipid-A-disaccharide synthase, partial [Candidatus Adiutrix sp.]